jgi:crotonobetaine/carnitine-CoA ligase
MAVLNITDAKQGDVFLLWEALHHGAGVAVIISAVIGGVTLAMVERFSASGFWDDVRRHGVTHIHYLGGVLPLLLKQKPSERDRDHNVRIAWGGGCPPEIWRDVEDRFGVELREGYGLSELITFVTLNKDGRVGSCGRPLSLFDIMIADDEGNELPRGETGEIVARGTQKGLGFLGYFRNEQTTRDTVRDGWLLTGDLGRMDEDGYIFYAGRKKEMLRRRGINISAWEVEQVVNKHAAVAESALVGVPSELGEDELKIFVKLVDGAAFDPMELVTFCETRMPYYQVPRYVAVIEEFPKTPTQRIRKKELSRGTEGAWDLDATGYKPGRKSA